MMGNIRKSRRNIIRLAFVLIVLMFIVDYFSNFNYIEKSLAKLAVFLLIPILYSQRNRYIDLKSFFRPNTKMQLLGSLILGIIVYGIVVGAYILLKDFIDLDKIQDILTNELSVNRENFLLVAFYISFFNSLLEEFFFRGFLFLGLKRLGSTLNAYLVSSLFFAIYHLGMVANWFDIRVLGLAILGLFLGGLIFNGLNHSNENIYNSWLVHMFANFAINTVGLIMFGLV